MAYNLYINGNIIYLIDTDNDIQYEGIAKECLHRRTSLSAEEFGFTGLNRWDYSNLIPFADINGKDGNPISNTYATAQLLSDYLDGELGKSSSQGGEQISGISAFNNFEPSVNVIDNNLVDGDIVQVTPTINVVNEFYFSTVVVNNTFIVNRVVINAVTGFTNGLPFRWRKLR